MTDVLNKKYKKIFFVGVLVFSVLVIFGVYVGYVLNKNGNNQGAGVSQESNILYIGNTSIHVDIADTPILREQGLSGRKTLPDSQGMFFVFDTAEMYQFWMKEMSFPIDIIWIDEDMSVVDITHSALPISFPKTFAPRVPIRYVLEVNAGFSAQHGIKIGDQVSLMRSTE